MAIIAKKSSSDIQPLAAGVYTGRCIGVVDAGEQYSERYKNWTHKVILIFEISGEKVNVDGEMKPRWLSKDFSLSLSERAALYKMITTWFNREPNEHEMADGFDLAILLNRPATLSVTVVEKNDARFNNITAILSVPASVNVPDAESEELYFDISEWDDAVFDKLPGWMKERIKRSAEYQKRLPQGVENIDIPDEPEGVQADETKKADTPNVPF